MTFVTVDTCANSFHNILFRFRQPQIRSVKMSSSMYKLVQTINSTKFRIEPFEEFYEIFEEIGT